MDLSRFITKIDHVACPPGKPASRPFKVVDQDAEALQLATADIKDSHAARPQRAIENAFRILKPGGRILILDLASHTYEQAKELYAHVWLGFSGIELHAMLEKSGFQNLEVSVVAREAQAPNFQTILATGLKK